MFFQLEATDSDSSARAGNIFTAHGIIETPIFMPVGTLGTVKGVHFQDIDQKIQADIILSNTYHLYLRPGTEILHQCGGIHQFNSWSKPVLTDSGGYQVYSLAQMRKITDEGVKFRSHIDGSQHFFTPEFAIDIQRKIGADIIMAFDECTPYPCEKSYAKKSLKITHQWLKRCIAQFDSTSSLYGYPQYLFPIVQGSTYSDLRKESADFVVEQDCIANAIGGLSVGEPHDEMYAMTEIVCGILPKEKPRYLMGVGTPSNILECIALGIDQFDCVMPTRNGRNGMLFTAEGIINIKNKKWEFDFSAIDASLENGISNLHSKSYLRHLFASGEMLGPMIASIHNLSFYLWLVKEARRRIILGDFTSWKNKLVKQLVCRL